MINLIRAHLGNRIRRKRCIDEIVAKMGWSCEETAKKADEAVKRLGISYRDYVRYKYYLVPVEEQQEKYNRIQRNRNKKDDKAVKNVMKVTGWDYEKAESMILEAQQRTGCTYTEYFIYRFYELSKDEQEQVFLVEDSKKLIYKYDVDREFAYILTDKGKTNEYFAEYLNRPWCINTKVTLEEFKKTFEDVERIMYKPIAGNRGKGIQAFYISAENIETVYTELKELSEGVVEAFVIQHPELRRLFPESVNTIRIVSISTSQKADIAYAALRIGNGKAVVDNFHSGGMTAAIALETGKIVTDAADMNGNVFAEHPVTGMKFKGFEVPYFNEAVELVKDAIGKNKIKGYLGWDIAISETGPVLIEVNVSPGVVLLSMPYAAEKRGTKAMMEKYM